MVILDFGQFIYINDYKILLMHIYMIYIYIDFPFILFCPFSSSWIWPQEAEALLLQAAERRSTRSTTRAQQALEHLGAPHLSYIHNNKNINTSNDNNNGNANSNQNNTNNYCNQKIFLLLILTINMICIHIYIYIAHTHIYICTCIQEMRPEQISGITASRHHALEFRW